MFYYLGQPIRFVENHLVDVNVLTGISSKEGDYFGFRSDYSDVEEIVDRKYWQPSTVAVFQVGKHPTQGQSMYDSAELLRSRDVASLNASIRHPSNDIVDTTRRLQQLKKITIEVAESDIKAQLEKAEAERRAAENKQSVPNNPSTPPESTIGG